MSNSKKGDILDIFNIIVNYLCDINPSVIESTDNLGNLSLTSVLDSLDMIDFLSFVEHTFSISINDIDALSKNFETIDSVVEFIMRRKSSYESVEK